MFSWLIWGSTTCVVFAAQLADRAGVGAWPIGVSGLVTANPLWAVLLLTLVDVLGFAPTFLKAYQFPYEEHLLFYMLITLRNLLTLAALQHYSLTTVFFPLVMAITCMLFILMVVYRRRKSCLG